MKIDIITCSRAQSYGAVLQTYASQTFIEKQGLEAQVIDYAPNYVTRSHKVLFVGDKRYKKNPFLLIPYLLMTGPSRFKRNKMFKKFLSKFIHLTRKKYLTYNDLCENPPIADAFICGSDQIWNINYPNGWDKSYYLGFVKNHPKCSYAASMALKKEALPEQYFSFLKEVLSSFDMLSVREDVAVDIVKNSASIDVTHVLDPVFLLNNEDWLSLEKYSEVKLDPDSYILIMPMGDGANVYDVAERIQNSLHLPIYNITFSQRNIKCVNRTFNACSPSTFLHLIKNARVVITNSFHGTAFSIIFEKDFWSCSIPGTSSRIESLLRSFELENRLIEGSIDETIIQDSINYNNIDKDTPKMKSISFLKSFIDSIQKHG